MMFSCHISLYHFMKYFFFPFNSKAVILNLKITYLAVGLDKLLSVKSRINYRKSKLVILDWYPMEKMYEIFLLRSDKYSTYRNAQKYSNTFRPIGGIFPRCILLCLDCTEHNKMHIHFLYAEKYVSSRIWFLIAFIICLQSHIK